MDVCEEMAIVRWVVGGEVVLQLGDGIDRPELGGTVNVFTVLGALCAGYLEDCHVMAITVSSRPDVGVLDVRRKVETVEGGDCELACPDQSEEGGGEARPYRRFKQICGVQFAE